MQQPSATSPVFVHVDVEITEALTIVQSVTKTVRSCYALANAPGVISAHCWF
jgi:hypothetical protein